MSERKDGADGGSAAPVEASLFLAALQERARQTGRDLDAQLQDQATNTVRAAGVLTEDCLFPDEVEQLLASPNLVFDRGSLIRKEGASLPAPEEEALAHLAGCDFCRPLVALMRPRLAEKEVFLEQMRAEAKLRRKEPQSVDDLSRATQGLGRRIGYAPVLLPALFAVFALTQSDIWTTPLVQALWVTAPIAVAAAAVAGVGVWTVANWKMAHYPKQLIGSLAACAACVLVAIPLMFGVNRAVVAGQKSVIESAVLHLAEPEAIARRLGGQDVCAQRISTGMLGCNPHNPLALQAQVRGTLGTDTADVYWQARGQRLRELQLVKAQVTEAKGGLQLLFASGETVPLKATAKTKYAVGDSLVAVRTSGSNQAVAAFNPDTESSEYALITPDAVVRQMK